LGTGALWAGGKGGPLQPGDLEPVNTFLGNSISVTNGNQNNQNQNAPLAPIAPGGRGGTGIFGDGSGVTSFSGATGTNGPSSSGGPNYSNTNNNGSAYTATTGKPVPTPTGTSGNPNVEPQVEPSAAVSPVAGASSSPSNSFFDNFSDSSGSAATGAQGQGSTVSGQFSTSGSGIFSSKGIFRNASSSDIQSAASLSPAEIEKQGLSDSLNKYAKAGNLPDQFQHGSFFAKVAGAGAIAPQEGASIQVGKDVYEFHGGTYVRIAAPKLAPERKPAGVAHLASTVELHANLGPVPIDRYEDKNDGILGACKQGVVVRDCIKAILADRAKQKVRGLRFMFGLTGGGYSTAIQEDGKISASWVKNLELFLKDVKDSGIRKIAPTPIFGGLSGDRAKQMEVTDGCTVDGHVNRKVKVKFFAGLPWGSRLEDGAPYDAGVVDAYKCSPSNPTFVGWKAIHSALENVLVAAQGNRLDVYELDLFHEMNVDWYTVEARMITDNKHAESGDPDLMKVARYLMTKHGFEASRVTYSVSDTAPSEPGYDCNSSYGDSARVAGLSALLEAIQGSPFGHAKDWSVEKGLGCGGSTAGRIRLPTKHNLPRLVDVHSYTTGEPGMIRVETTLWANAVDSAMKRRGLASATFILGETHSNTRGPNGKSCEGAAPDAGVELARAFNDSKLAARGAILRPWFNATSSCYSPIQRLNPPFVPSH
jgi:hypothetical protein